MTLRLLGTVTTDSKGEATLSYVGNGRGLVQFVAKKGNLQSDTIEVLDCLYYFVNTYTSYKNSYVTVTSNTNDVTLTAGANTGTVFLSDDNSFLTGNYAFEFKLVSYTSDSATIRCGNTSSSTRAFTLSALSPNNGDVFTLKNNGTVVEIWKNGTKLSTTVSNNGTIKYGFNIPSGESITVTDMKVYPI